MTRFHNWPELLAAHIISSREAKFRWGHFDCALFAAGAIHAMTGTDLAADFRGKYHDEAGGRPFFARAMAHPGGVLRLVDLVFAARGDLVLTNNGSTEPGLGIVGLDGNKALCAG